MPVYGLNSANLFNLIDFKIQYFSTNRGPYRLAKPAHRAWFDRRKRAQLRQIVVGANKRANKLREQTRLHHAQRAQFSHLSRIQPQLSQYLVGVFAQARGRMTQHRWCSRQPQRAGHGVDSS